MEESQAELVDVVTEWFVDRLDSSNARAPVPEIWPAMRIVDSPVTVSMVAPQGVVIHYTTDGTEPTTASTRYAEPFIIPPDTVVKAIGTMPQRQPSGAAIARFYKGPVPPQLTQTERHLPPAQTGKPYPLLSLPIKLIAATG